MVTFFQSLPLYQQINAGILLTGFGLISLLWIFGNLTVGLTRRNNPLPPIPLFSSCNFPGIWDQIGIYLLCLFFTVNCLMGLNVPEESSAMSATESAISGTIILCLIYFPFLVRYTFLPGWKKNQYYFFQGCLHIVAMCIGIFMISGIMQASGFTSWLCETTGTPATQDIVQNFKEDSGNEEMIATLLTLFTSVIVAPVAEECCFRGFLFSTLKKVAGVPAAIIATSIFFASIHMALVQQIPLFILSVLLCLLYNRTRSLLLPILLHMAVNSTTVIALLFLS